jgi:hypothetical protein
MPWLLAGGGLILLAVLLRSNNQASNVKNQTPTSAASHYVPFANAGSAGSHIATITSGIVLPKGVSSLQLSWNPKATNGNGQALSPPDAAVINAGSQTAVINQNIANAQSAAKLGQSIFVYLDPVKASTGADVGKITYANTGIKPRNGGRQQRHYVAFAPSVLSDGSPCSQAGAVVTQGNL